MHGAFAHRKLLLAPFEAVGCLKLQPYAPIPGLPCITCLTYSHLPSPVCIASSYRPSNSYSWGFSCSRALAIGRSRCHQPLWFNHISFVAALQLLDMRRHASRFQSWYCFVHADLSLTPILGLLNTRTSCALPSSLFCHSSCALSELHHARLHRS